MTVCSVSVGRYGAPVPFDSIFLRCAIVNHISTKANLIQFVCVLCLGWLELDTSIVVQIRFFV